jgi:hypothetical protein
MTDTEISLTMSVIYTVVTILSSRSTTTVITLIIASSSPVRTIPTLPVVVAFATAILMVKMSVFSTF